MGNEAAVVEAPAAPAAEAPVQPAPAPAPAAPTAAPSTTLTAPPAAAPAAPAKPEAAKPEIKYDLKLPKDSILKADQLEKTAAFARERGFSPEQAQAIVDRDSAAAAQFAEQQKAMAAEAVTGWISASKADKEIGGEAFGKNVELARRVVERFGTSEFKEALNETGLGNHPELLRVFARIGQKMSEDQMVLGSQKAVPGAKKSLDEVFYGPKQEAAK